MRTLTNSSLALSRQCHTQRSTPDYRGVSTPEANRSITVRTVLRDYCSGAISPSDVEGEFTRRMASAGYKSPEQLAEISANLLRGITSWIEADIERASVRPRIFIAPVPMTVKVFGEEVNVSPDCVSIVETITGEKQVEVVKFSASSTRIARKSGQEKSIGKSLELFSMFLYGMEVAKGDATISVVSGQYNYVNCPEITNSKRWWRELNPDAAEGIRACRFSVADVSVAESLYRPAWAEFRAGRKCDEADCTFCDKKGLCGFKPVPSQVPAVEEHVGTFRMPSPAQEAVISFREGVARVVASAGAGKTYVLTTRATMLLLEGAERQLLVTFTKNAAAELRQRIESLAKTFGLEIPDAMVCTTFDGLAYEVVRENWEKIGLPRQPEMVGNRKNDLILETVAGRRLPDVSYSSFNSEFNSGFRTISDAFDWLKRKGISGFTWDGSKEGDKDDPCPVALTQEWLDAFDAYCERLEAESLIEYPDAAHYLRQIMKVNPDYMTDRYGFEHVVVDEFQDTDDVQMSLLGGLFDSECLKSLLVVGDCSQNIFGFRGTSDKSFKNLDRLLATEVKDFELPENYRSTGNIISLANNTNARIGSLGGPMVSARGKPGRGVDLLAFASEARELKFIAEQVKVRVDAGQKPEEIAVIAATSAELLEVGTWLTRFGVPWWLLTPEKVNQNSRVRAAISLAELINNPSLSACALEYQNVVSDGELWENRNPEEMSTAIKAVQNEVSALSETYSKNEVFRRMEERISEKGDALYEDFAKSYSRCLGFSGLLTHLRNVRDFGGKETFSRTAYKGSGVILTTAHSSKGLEFSKVYLSATKLYKKSDLVASQKLLFTAITRAKDELTITVVDPKKSGKRNGGSFFEELSQDLGISEAEFICNEENPEEEVVSQRNDLVKRILTQYAKGEDVSELVRELNRIS